MAPEIDAHFVMAPRSTSGWFEYSRLATRIYQTPLAASPARSLAAGQPINGNLICRRRGLDERLERHATNCSALRVGSSVQRASACAGSRGAPPGAIWRGHSLLNTSTRVCRPLRVFIRRRISVRRGFQGMELAATPYIREVLAKVTHRGYPLLPRELRQICYLRGYVHHRTPCPHSSPVHTVELWGRTC